MCEYEQNVLYTHLNVNVALKIVFLPSMHEVSGSILSTTHSLGNTVHWGRDRIESSRSSFTTCQVSGQSEEIHETLFQIHVHTHNKTNMKGT